jgi:hypothetical protein
LERVELLRRKTLWHEVIDDLGGCRSLDIEVSDKRSYTVHLFPTTSAL